MGMQIKHTSLDIGARVAILGAGEMGMQAAHYAPQSRQIGKNLYVVGFFDDTKTAGYNVCGYKILGGTEDIEAAYANGDFDFLFVAIGYKHSKKKKEIIERFLDKVPIANILHPTSYIDPTADIGNNIMIYPGCIVDKNVALHDGAVVNLGCIISHDTIVGKSTFVAPGAVVAGFTTIGDECFIGCGSSIIDNINICDGTTIGAGTVVTANIEKPGTYVGAPARRIK